MVLKKIKMKVLINRDLYHKEGTIGRLFVDGDFFCCTLERPDNGNQPDNKLTIENDAGCIPEGTYTLKKDYNGDYQYFKVLNVPNRTNIELHQANRIGDLSGCIGLGDKITEDWKYRGKKYKFWASNSKKTCQELKDYLPEECELTITSNRTKSLLLKDKKEVVEKRSLYQQIFALLMKIISCFVRK